MMTQKARYPIAERLLMPARHWQLGMLILVAFACSSLALSTANAQTTAAKTVTSKSAAPS